MALTQHIAGMNVRPPLPSSHAGIGAGGACRREESSKWRAEAIAWSNSVSWLARGALRRSCDDPPANWSSIYSDPGIDTLARSGSTEMTMWRSTAHIGTCAELFVKKGFVTG